jgi:hypothetical protein
VGAGELRCAPRIATELILGVLEARAVHAFLARRPASAREQATFVRVLLKNVLR